MNRARAGAVAAGEVVGPVRPSRARQWLDVARRKPIGTACLLVILVMFVMGVFAPFVGTTDINFADNRNRFASISWENWFGTDQLGRDFYTQMVYGVRVTFTVAFLAVGVASSTGLILGIVSGYYGGWVDNLIQRVIDIMLSFPGIVMALAIMAVLGQGIDKVIFAIAVVFAPRAARIIRGSVLSVKENVYVDAAHAVGCSPLRVMARHIAPGVMAVYLIIASAELGGAVLLEASLSFLGLGVPPPNPSWGRFLSGNAANFAFTAPHIMIIPGIAITILVLAFNLLGDTLRDIWDPRLRGR